jgi:hypothetical protein
MILTGVKVIVERKDGTINTWHDGPTHVVEAINSAKERKGWVGGKIIEAYYEFDSDGYYVKTWIDVSKNCLNDLLKD